MKGRSSRRPGPRGGEGAVATKPVQAVLLVAFGTAVAILGAELFLRWWSTDAYYVWRPNLERVFPAVPGVMPGVTGESRFVINEDGIRGRPFSDESDYRILTLGGSTTECLFLDESEAWPRLLEVELDRRFPEARVWVGNVGKAGHSARHHALQAEKLFPQYPPIDAAVILVGVNDLLVRLRRDEDFVPLAEASPEYRDTLYDQAFSVAPPYDVHYPFYKRTALYRTLRRAVRGTGRPTSRTVVDQGAGAGYLVRVREARLGARRLLDTLPDLRSALDDYAENLNRTVTALRDHGVKPILVTQPSMWRDSLPPELERLLWFGEKGMEQGIDYYSAAALARGLREFNETLLGVCEERGLSCVDLAAALPRDTTIFYDAVHFNEPGARRVAAELADALSTMPDVRAELAR